MDFKIDPFVQLHQDVLRLTEEDLTPLMFLNPYFNQSLPHYPTHPQTLTMIHNSLGNEISGKGSSQRPSELGYLTNI